MEGGGVCGAGVGGVIVGEGRGLVVGEVVVVFVFAQCGASGGEAGAARLSAEAAKFEDLLAHFALEGLVYGEEGGVTDF